jgi:hypothetical protein
MGEIRRGKWVKGKIGKGIGNGRNYRFFDFPLSPFTPSFATL